MSPSFQQLVTQHTRHKLDILLEQFPYELSVKEIDDIKNYKDILVVFINNLVDVCDGKDLSCSVVNDRFITDGNYIVRLYVERTYLNFRENILKSL